MHHLTLLSSPAQAANHLCSAKSSERYVGIGIIDAASKSHPLLVSTNGALKVMNPVPNIHQTIRKTLAILETE